MRASMRVLHLANLRVLIVSGEFIQSGSDDPEPIARRPRYALPHNLEVLQIICTVNMCPWCFLDRLAYDVLAGDFPRLVTVQLCFNTTCPSLAACAMLSDPNPVFQGVKVFVLLKRWQLLRTSLETNFLNGKYQYEQGDDLKEMRSIEMGAWNEMMALCASAA